MKLIIEINQAITQIAPTQRWRDWINTAGIGMSHSTQEREWMLSVWLESSVAKNICEYAVGREPTK